MLIALNCSVFCFILQQQRLSYSCPDARTAAASAFAAHRPPAPFANPFATTSTLICLAANRICLSYHSRCQRRSAQPDANRGCLRPQCRTCSGTCCTVEERTSLSLEPVLREPSLSCLLLQLFFLPLLLSMYFRSERTHQDDPKRRIRNYNYKFSYNAIRIIGIRFRSCYQSLVEL